MTETVLIIGAGNIAHRYDSPESPLVLTHAKAFTRHPDFSLIAICDNDPNRAKEAAILWQIPHHGANAKDFFSLHPSVISICTPDSTHAPLLWQCLEARPRLVFCEKPLSLNTAEAEKIVSAYRQADIPLAINYSRRWLPKIMSIPARIEAGEFGMVISARIKYYNGFLHNGSHLIDLINAFLRPQMMGGSILLAQNAGEQDMVISAACRCRSPFGEFPLMIEGYAGTHMAPFELEIILSNTRILIEEANGTWLTFFQLQSNTVYPDFHEFIECEKIKITPESAMANAVANIAKTLTEQKALASSGETAMETLQLCKNILSLPHCAL
jgi:predicted dehydrogenase